MQTKEKNFEQDIETYLLNEGGYIKGDQSREHNKIWGHGIFLALEFRGHGIFFVKRFRGKCFFTTFAA